MIDTFIPARFDANLQAWSYQKALFESSQSNSFTVATYNVWFGDYYYQKRAEALLAILQQAKIDVIGLHEVTPPFLQILLEKKWVRQNYWISDFSGGLISPYGTLLLSRIPLQKLSQISLPGQMGRQLLVAVLLINDEETIVATTHLESLGERDRRVQQLNIIFRTLAKHSHVVFMGDFNFDAKGDENNNIDPAYTDIWPFIHPHANGYTKDSTINQMPYYGSGTADMVRFDRVLLRSKAPGWEAAGIRLLGMESISPNMPLIFPSDHFGLFAKLDWVD